MKTKEKNDPWKQSTDICNMTRREKLKSSDRRFIDLTEKQNPEINSEGKLVQNKKDVLWMRGGEREINYL